MKVDYETAYDAYLARFAEHFQDKPEGAFAKFGKHMVQKLSRKDFAERLDLYLRMHAECKRMINSGATISDALVLDFEEASAWLVLEAPNLLGMFQGEIGDPDLATGKKRPRPGAPTQSIKRKA